MTAIPQALERFLAAINARDVDAVSEVFTDDIVYHFIVPHPPARGRAAVLEALGKSLHEADRVLWELRSWSASGDLMFAERIDRFWFGDREAAIECVGAFALRDGLISEVRDYADLGTWRTRKNAALER